MSRTHSSWRLWSFILMLLVGSSGLSAQCDVTNGLTNRWIGDNNYTNTFITNTVGTIRLNRTNGLGAVVAFTHQPNHRGVANQSIESTNCGGFNPVNSAGQAVSVTSGANGEFTMSAWVYQAQSSTVFSGTYYVFVSADGAYPYLKIANGYCQTGYWDSFRGALAVNYNIGGNPVSEIVGAWVHYTVVCTPGTTNNSATYTLYQNGVMVGTNQSVGLNPTLNPLIRLGTGNCLNGGGPGALTYRFHDVRTYSRALSASEVNTIAQFPSQLSIVTQPTSVLVPECTAIPTSVSMSVSATSTLGSTLSYQWFRNGVPVTNGAGISGANGTTLTFSNPTANNFGAYTCSVSDNCGSSTVTGNAGFGGNDYNANVYLPFSGAFGNSGTGGATINTGQSLTTDRLGNASSAMMPVGGSTGNRLNSLMLPYNLFSYAVPNGRTVSLWFKSNRPGSIMTSSAEEWGTVASSVYTQVNNMFYIGSNGRLMAQFWNPNGASPIQSANVVTDNEWHHAALVYNATTNLQTLYVDGVAQATTITGYTTRVGHTVVGKGLALAAAWPNTPSILDFDNQAVDEVIVADRAFSLTEISALSGIRILSQPQSQAICQGAQLNLTAGVAGGGLSYQWYRNGVVIPNATTTTYTVPNAQASNSGNYTLVITNGTVCTAVTTTVASVIVQTTQASITTQPASQVVCQGSTATLSVVAPGATGYQWMLGGANILGATSSSYIINGVMPSNTGAYTVSITGCGNTLNSNVANLTVNGFLRQPTDQVIACAASIPATFSVQTTSQPISYRWRFNGNNITNNAVYSGATSATLTVSSGTTAELGVYDCVVTFNCGSITSSTVTLSSINTGTQLRYAFNNNLTDASGNARNGTGSGQIVYTADRNGVANSAVNLNGSLVSAPAGNYFGNGSFTFATWVRIGAYTQNARLFDFGDGAAINNVVAYINASGNINVAYYNGAISSNTLTTPNAVPLNTWTHFAWVQNGLDAKLYINGTLVANQPNMVQIAPNTIRTNCYIASSNWANDPMFTGAFDDFNILNRALSADEINLLSGSVLVTSQPMSASSCSSQPVTLSVTAPSALTYQWQLNGVNIPNATSSIYTANGTAASYGVYRVWVASACNSAFSNNATVSAGTSQDITTGLYAHYKMNGNTLDASGNNRTATGVTPTYTTDRANSNGLAGNYTGTQYLSLNAATFMQNTAAKTYSVWFKTTATNVPLVGIARAAVNSTNQGYYCYMHINNNGRLDGGTYNGGFLTVSPSTVLVNDGQWHLATWTNNGSNTQSIYLDGTLVGSTSDGSTLLPSSGVPNGSLYFGIAQIGGYPNFVGNGTNGWVGYNGQMDDARVYDRSLTAGQIYALYQEAVINFAQSTASTCAGQSLTLTPQIYSVASPNYAWTFNGANATNGNGISGVNTNTLNIANATTANAGAYNLVVTTNTCNAFSGTPVTVTLGAAPSITTQPQNRTICPGGNTSFGITATNVTSYQWRRNGVNINGAVNATLNITNAQSANVGNYDVLMTSACGTLTSNTVTLALSASAPSITSANTTITCAQNSVSLTATAGTTYRWSNNQTTQAINVTAAGTYTVTVTDASSCTGTSAITVTANTVAPTVSIATPATITCAVPQVTLTASGNATSYAWTGGPATATRTVTTAGTYTVVATAANGCTASSSAIVTSNVAAPTVSIAAPATITCVVPQVTLTASGNATSYAWTGGPATATRTVTAAGTYTVVGTNAAGCTASASVSVSANTLAPTVSIAAPATITCVVPQVTLTASGNATSYAWTGGPATATRTVTSAGTYTVVATAANGCTASSSAIVTSNVAAPTVSIAAPATITCAVSQVTLTASGNATSYAWTGGPATATRTVTSAGTYTVVATGANGCTASTSVSVSVNTTVPTAAVSPNNVTLTCVASSANLTASGGTSYLWSNGQTTATISVAAANTYRVTVTGANGCTSTSSAIVTAATGVPQVVITPTAQQLNCAVTAITLTASGANSYAWTGGPATATRTITAAGTYTVVGTNAASGCTASTSVNITRDITAPSVTIAAPAQLTCATTQVTLTANGAASYAWVGGPATATRVVTAVGAYTVVGTGANGCTASQAVTVTSNTVAPPTAAASVNQTATNANFPAVITIAGYNPNLYSYRLLNFTTNVLVANMNGPTVTNATGGVFKVEITSLANGCVSYSNRIKVIYDANFGMVIGTASIPGSVNRPAGGKVVSEDFGTNATPVGVFYDMHVYPNPASDYLNINYEFEQETEAHFSLYSADGRMVWEQKTSSASNLLQVNVTDFPSGQYFLRMSSQSLTKTVLVQVVN